MTGRGVLLRLLMNELDIDPKLGEFGSRLRLQKTVYLLQKLGMPTNFSYGWYIHGPYSPSLTETAFEQVVKAEIQDDNTWDGYRLSQETREKVEQLKQLIGLKPEDTQSEEEWLELLASMLFYKDEMYFPPSRKKQRKDPEWLYDQLPARKKSMFTSDEAVEASKALAASGLWGS